MLHHYDPTQTDTPGSAGEPAAQVRVTAEEFARAVARYQARREEAAQRLEGTLTLGEAVHELNLDVSPEELLAEVQAERASEKLPKKAHGSRLGILAGLLAMLIFGSGLMIAFNNSGAVPPDTPLPNIVATSPPVSPFAKAAATILVRDAGGPKPVLRTLGEVSDGRAVYASLEQTDSRVSFASFSDPHTSWTLIKHGGRVYVRAWITSMSPKAMHAGAVNLYRDKSLVPSGVAPQHVTLALDGFQCIPGDGDDDMIVAQTVRNDSHFNEAWQPIK